MVAVEIFVQKYISLANFNNINSEIVQFSIDANCNNLFLK
jgi:hypothetical protein